MKLTKKTKQKIAEKLPIEYMERLRGGSEPCAATWP